jgi:hypothetical protein
LGQQGSVCLNLYLQVMGLLKKISGIFCLSKKEFKHKGHELIISHKSLIFDNKRSSSFVVEIGSDRNAGSTYHIAKLTNRYALNFITVDIDKKATARAEKILKKINKKFLAINDYGEEYLKKFNSPIWLVYLDAFDIPGLWHTREVIDSYNNRNIKLTLENCHKMHYECAVSICGKMSVGGFVCFDDVNPVDDSGNLIFDRVSPDYKLWSGKGATAIPYLIENGFELIDNKRACALLRRIK